MSKVIYALFDDGNQSVKKTMEPLGYKVYSFGIQDKDTVIKCDLTDLENFFKVSKNLPLPDFIMANPPCETFSIGTACSYEDGKKGTIYYYNNGQEVNDFEQWKTSSYPNLKRLKSDKEEYFNELKKKRAVGELLHHNTDEIIKFFGVPSVVENPQTSYCWKMFHKEFKKSVAHYIAYDRKFTKKPTTFASNVELNLLKATKDMKQEHRWGYGKGQKNGNGYNKRSSIPEKLIIDIFKQLEDSVK